MGPDNRIVFRYYALLTTFTAFIWIVIIIIIIFIMIIYLFNKREFSPLSFWTVLFLLFFVVRNNPHLYCSFFSDPSYYVSRMAGFFLYVSNTMFIEDAHLCFHHTHTQYGKPSLSQTIQCSVRGRYVIYYNERKWNVNYPRYFSNYAYNELCELEVYGESQSYQW